MARPNKQTQFNIWYALAAMLRFFLFQSWWVSYKTVEQVPYSQFEQLLQQGQVAKIWVNENTIEGTYKKPKDNDRHRFVTVRVDKDISQLLDKYNVTYRGVVTNTFLSDLFRESCRSSSSSPSGCSCFDASPRTRAGSAAS